MTLSSNPHQNYLNVRLSGEDDHVERTPGYDKWRKEAISPYTSADQERLCRRLGGAAGKLANK